MATAAFAGLLALIDKVASIPQLGLIVGSILVTQFSISALNDLVDRHADAMANRARPVATGRIPPRLALALAIGFAIVAVALATPFGLIAVLLLLLGLAAGWAYDLVLKATVLSFLPFAIAFPLLVIWVAHVAGRPLHHLALLLLGGIALAIAVHLADSIPDRLIDGQAGMRTLPVVWPFPVAEVVAGLLLLIGIAASDLAVWQAGRLSWFFLAPFALVALYFANALSRTSRDPRATQQLAKWTLVADAGFCGIILSLVAGYG